MSVEPITNPNEHLRPQVLRFALLMERELRANDGKPGWRDDEPGALLERACEELAELRAVLTRGAWDHSEASRQRREISKEAADVANFCMMIADVAGGLPDATKFVAERQPSRLALVDVDAEMALAQGRLELSYATCDREARLRDAAEDQLRQLRIALERINRLYLANNMEPIETLLSIGMVVRNALDELTPPVKAKR